MKKVIYAFLILSLGIGCVKDDKDCPDGFAGEDCNQELTPERVDLKSISVTVTSTGWDVFPTASPPDIFFIVESAGGTELLETTICTNSNTCTWTGTLSFGPSETCVVKIYDSDDLGIKELIGSYTLDLYSNGAGFPTSHTATLSGVTASVGLSYVH
jgi:hypothetical protein